MKNINQEIKEKEHRLNNLKNNIKDIKCPGVVKKLTRQIRNLKEKLEV
jgi:archaellum component FlaC